MVAVAEALLGDPEELHYTQSQGFILSGLLVKLTQELPIMFASVR